MGGTRGPSQARVKAEVQEVKPPAPLGLRLLDEEVDIQSLLGEEDPYYTVVDPSMYDVDLPRIDTSRQEDLIREGADRRIQAGQDILGQAQQDAQMARMRLLRSLGGANLMKAFSGAPIKTGVRENLALQREAEQRAQEIEREFTGQAAELEAESRLRAQALRDQTGLANARQEAKEGQIRREGLSNLTSSLNDYNAERLGAETDKYEAYLDYLNEEAKRLSGGGGGANFRDKLNYIKMLNKDPHLAGEPAIQQMGRSLGFQDINSIAGAANRVGTSPGDLFPINMQVRELSERLASGQGEPIEASGMAGSYLREGGGITDNIEEARRKPLSALERERLSEQLSALKEKRRQLLEDRLRMAIERKDGVEIAGLAGLMKAEGLVPKEEADKLLRVGAEWTTPQYEDRPQQVQGGFDPKAVEDMVMRSYGRSQESDTSETPSQSTTSPDTSDRSPSTPTQPASLRSTPRRDTSESVVEEARNLIGRGVLGQEAGRLLSGIEALREVSGPEAERRLEELEGELESVVRRETRQRSRAEQARRADSLQAAQQGERDDRELRDLKNALARDLQQRNSAAWGFLREDQKAQIEARIKRYRRQIRSMGGNPNTVEPGMIVEGQ